MCAIQIWFKTYLIVDSTIRLYVYMYVCMYTLVLWLLALQIGVLDVI